MRYFAQELQENFSCSVARLPYNRLSTPLTGPSGRIQILKFGEIQRSIVKINYIKTLSEIANPSQEKKT